LMQVFPKETLKLPKEKLSKLSKRNVLTFT
jgi:hypothetical protein